MIVGVFGTWRAQRGDPVYHLAEEFGRSLAQAGHAVLTGGYAGVMEAANRGAAEVGGRSIGITCPEIDRHLAMNPWVNDPIRESDLPARLATCFRLIQAALFLPGRSGTITELALALEMREKGILPHPVFLTCNYWDGFISACRETNCALDYPSSKSLGTRAVSCKTPRDLISRLSACS